MAYTIRPARTSDVPGIRKLIDANVESGRLLSKATVTLYEDVQEFCVADLDRDTTLAGCGALHVMWEDLAEIRTIAVREDCQGFGIGHGIVDALLARARAQQRQPGARFIALSCGDEGVAFGLIDLRLGDRDPFD